MAESVIRWFIDDREVSLAEALTAESTGTAQVIRAGSGIVPTELRQPGETKDQTLRPWGQMRSIT